MRRGFYDGQRVHRAVPGFVVQWGDPRRSDVSRKPTGGRLAASSGQPIGVAEMANKRPHTRGAVAIAHAGEPGRRQPDVRHAREPSGLNGHYAVFGHIVEGEDVVERLQRGERLITKMTVRE